MRNEITKRLNGVAAAVLLFACSGCVSQGLRATSEPSLPAEGNAELMEYIAGQPFITANAGYRAIRLLVSEEPFSGSFEELTADLVQRHVVDSHWNYDPLQYLDNASVAYMISRAAHVGMSLNFAVTGFGRYAWKELQYRRIAEPGSEYSLTTGGQFLAMLSKTDDYLHEVGRAPGQRSELGADPSGKGTPPSSSDRLP